MGSPTGEKTIHSPLFFFKMRGGVQFNFIYTILLCLSNSETLQVLMFICPKVRFKSLTYMDVFILFSIKMRELFDSSCVFISIIFIVCFVLCLLNCLYPLSKLNIYCFIHKHIMESKDFFMVWSVHTSVNLYVFCYWFSLLIYKDRSFDFLLNYHMLKIYKK